MPAPVLSTGATNAQRGVGSAETGIKIESLDASYNNPKDYLRDEYGTRVGFAIGYDADVSLSISGEVVGATGVMAASFTSAYNSSSGDALDNQVDLDHFEHDGSTAWDAGKMFLESATITRATARRGSRMSANFTIYTDVT